MYIAEVYLLHCSSNLVAPSSPLCQYHVPCVHLSLSLSSSLSAFHVHAWFHLSLSLSPRSAPYISVSLLPIPLHPGEQPTNPHPPFHSAPTSENGFPTWTWNGFRKVLLTCGHLRKHTPHTWPHSIRVCTLIPIRARTGVHQHTATPDRYYDDRYARTTFFLPLLSPSSFSLLALHPGSLPVLLQLAGSQPEFTGATTNQDTRVRRVASPWAAPFQNEFFFPLLRAFLSSVCVGVCTRVFFFFFLV